MAPWGVGAMDGEARSGGRGGSGVPDDEAALVLTLFVTDLTPSSTRARRQLERWLETSGRQGVRLDVVDVLEHPDVAEAEHVLATPALIRRYPLPRRKIIGDLRDWEQVALALDVEEMARP